MADTTEELEMKIGEGSVRAKALDAIKKATVDNELMTCEELAAHIGFPVPSVRRELTKLRAEGLIIEAGVAPSKSGRSATTYAAAPEVARRDDGALTVPGVENVGEKIDQLAAGASGPAQAELPIAAPSAPGSAITLPASAREQMAHLERDLAAANKKVAALEAMTDRAHAERDAAKKEAEELAAELAARKIATGTEGEFDRRFWALVEKTTIGGCWPWKGPINSEGQGVFKVAGQGVRAKRLAVELSRGAPLDDSVMIGACKTSRLCLNPVHLGVRSGAKPGQKKEGSEEDPRQRSLFKYPCPVEGCEAGFDLKGDLVRHRQDAHSATPDPGELPEAEKRAAGA